MNIVLGVNRGPGNKWQAQGHWVALPRFWSPLITSCTTGMTPGKIPGIFCAVYCLPCLYICFCFWLELRSAAQQFPGLQIATLQRWPVTGKRGGLTHGFAPGKGKEISKDSGLWASGGFLPYTQGGSLPPGMSFSLGAHFWRNGPEFRCPITYESGTPCYEKNNLLYRGQNRGIIPVTLNVLSYLIRRG